MVLEFQWMSSWQLMKILPSMATILEQFIDLHYAKVWWYMTLLVSLMDLLEAADIQIPKQVKEADILTQFAVRTRYPGWIEPVTEQEYLEALALAQAVVNWAVSLISQLNDNRKS